MAEYEVEVQRLDQIGINIQRPCLCKIDVQGSEVDVIRGMEGISAKIDILIVVSSFIATIKGGPEIADVLDVCRRLGFVAYDIIGVTRRPLDSALAQIDLVLVPEDSPLRPDRRWSA